MFKFKWTDTVVVVITIVIIIVVLMGSSSGRPSKCIQTAFSEKHGASMLLLAALAICYIILLLRGMFIEIKGESYTTLTACCPTRHLPHEEEIDINMIFSRGKISVDSAIMSALLVVLVCFTSLHTHEGKKKRPVLIGKVPIDISGWENYNQAGTFISRNLTNQNHWLHRAYGSHLDVGILTRATPEIYNYAAYSLLNMAIYADINSYLLLPLYPDSSQRDYSLHRKIVPIVEALENVAEDVDYLVWMDADVIILDLNMRIEQIAARYPKAHLLLSADVSAIANSGVIIIRNTKWSINFLREWLSVGYNSTQLTDQMGFDIVYRRRLTKGEKGKIVILPPHILNSEAPPMGRQLPYHQVLHLAAESSDMRREVFRNAAKELCSALTLHRPPASQLGQTREVLQQTAIRVYGESAREMLDMLRKEQRSSTPTAIVYDKSHQFFAEHEIEFLQILRRSVSKYCHARSYSQGDMESAHTLAMRTELQGIVSDRVDTVLSQLNVSRSAMPEDNDSDNRFSSPFPTSGVISSVAELLKLSAEHQYLGGYISDILVLLVELTAPDQQMLVLDMQASLYTYFGEMALREGNFTSAVQHLRTAVDMFDFMRSRSMLSQSTQRSNGDGDGDGGSSTSDGGGGDLRAEYQALELLAGALCATSSHKEGFTLFREVIRRESDHVGPLHHNLISKYVNAGICACELRRYREAKEYFEISLVVIDRHPHIDNKPSKLASSKYLKLCLGKIADNNSL
eukprot:gene3385-6715_t